MTYLQGILSGIRPTIVSLIGTAAISMIILSFWKEPITKLSAQLLGNINYIGLISFVACLFVLLKYKVNPVFVIIASGFAGVMLYSIF